MTLILSPDEKLSFESGYKIKTLTGPAKLFRLVGRNATGESGNKFGRFWFHEDLFWDSIDEISDTVHDEKMMNHLIRRLLRELTAVCYDWNSFAVIYTLEVPAGKSIEVATGRIKPQPHYSSNDPLKRIHPKKIMLFGGEQQYIIEVVGEIKCWVKGPIPLHFRVGHA